VHYTGPRGSSGRGVIHGEPHFAMEMNADAESMVLPGKALALRGRWRLIFHALF
jgi:hypothetical protein